MYRMMAKTAEYPSEGPGTDFDVAVIGAGLAGISFARFYLETRPECRLLVLEQEAVIGGVWSSERVFDEFWCQSPLRQTTFSDMLIRPPPEATVHYEMFASKYVSQYLEEYVDNHSYGSRTIRDRIWFKAKVLGVGKTADGWHLDVDEDLESRIVSCGKLIVATGITTIPMIPAFLLASDCPIEVIHHRNFAAAAPRVFAEGSKCQNVTVIGGGKSVADLAYAAAKAGRKVNWLVRESGGEGPAMLLDAPADPYRHIGEASNTLSSIVLSPSPFKPLGGYTSRIHAQTDEAALMEKLLATDRKCKAFGRYHDRLNALPGFHNLEPTGSYFWGTAPSGVRQQPDFWDVISQTVHVYRGDVLGVDAHSIVLKDGRRVPTDVALCGTGWSMACPFLTPDQISHFGLPHEPNLDNREEYAEWNSMLKEADELILKDYPILRLAADISQRSMSSTLIPGRLYRGIAPWTDDSILFLGRTRVANSFRTSEAQAIWATAYLDGNIRLPSLEERKQDVAYHAMFSKRRYPTRGASGLNLYADLMWYTDTLVSDAGLISHRKDWWYDWKAPALQSDFRDCKDEYLAKYGLGGKVGKLSVPAQMHHGESVAI